MTDLDARIATIFTDKRERVFRETDRMFAWLLVAQWLLAIGLALATSPFVYEGSVRHVHLHLKIAVVFGAVLNVLPLVLVRTRPGWWGTRHVIAATQMLWSAVLIMVTGGRIETHFHVFGSLAFLAFYRDWKVLPTATLVVAIDHLARGLWWPDSVYGTSNPEWWRFLEHAAWVAFEDVVLVFGCLRQLREMGEAAQHEAREAKASNDKYRALVETTAAIPFEWDFALGRMAYLAPQAATLLDCTTGQLADSTFLVACIHPVDRERLAAETAAFIAGTRPANEPIDVRVVTAAGATRHVRVFESAIADGRLMRGVALDITQHKKLEHDLQQAQKLESVGRLAAGVAHEINTPIQFVGDSVQFVRDSLDQVFTAFPAEASNDEELAYLIAEYPKALDRALEGISRVNGIVRSMKVFAHPEQTAMTAVDLNAALDSTLTIARNEYKYVADVDTRYGELPKVTCRAGEINQVILNIVINAAHAIGDVVGESGARGKLGVETRCEGSEVIVSISDTGGGVPDHIRDRVFDPFFTTKEVGRGTGQGLAIARAVIDKHSGALTFDSVPGGGTTFHIRLPIAPPAGALEVAA